MHYEGLIPKDIQQFIDEYRRGRKVQYYYCKEDTQEAIKKLQSLSYEDYVDIAALFDWFIKTFLMRASTKDSFYRAFLTLYNDEILNFRLSRHYATESSTSDAFMRYGQSDIEYHLVIERVPSTSSSPPIASTTDFMGTSEVIFEVSFNDFKNNDGWKTFAKDLIAYLKYGKSKGITENKQYRHMKKLVRLTESDLHKIVKESVNRIINEINVIDKIPNFDRRKGYGKYDGKWMDTATAIDKGKEKYNGPLKSNNTATMMRLSPEEMDAVFADEENDFMENPIERPQRRNRGMQLYTIYEVCIDERHPEEHRPWRMIECDATFDDVTAMELEVEPYCGSGTDEEGNYWFETLYNSEIPYIKKRFVAVRN